MKRNTVLLSLAVIAAVALGAWFGPRLRRGAQADSLPGLLALAPADATMIVYADLRELRATPLVARLIAMAPPANFDRDYAEFVRGTGFAFERDLDRMVLASRPGPASQTVVFAEGRFDREKISQYALRSGKLEDHNGRSVYVLPSATPGKNVSIVFLEGNRIALSDGDDPSTMIPMPGDAASVFEPALNERLSRVAGSPFFAVGKVSPPTGSSPAPRTAGPATPFQYLQWISVAAKPDGEQVILSAEGECDGPENAQKVASAMEFLRAMLSGGLSDPKVRGSVTPDAAAAANRLLQAAKISNDASRVRLLVTVTPDMIGALGPPVNRALPAPALPAPKSR